MEQIHKDDLTGLYCKKIGVRRIIPIKWNFSQHKELSPATWKTSTFLAVDDSLTTDIKTSDLKLTRECEPTPEDHNNPDLQQNATVQATGPSNHLSI